MKRGNFKDVEEALPNYKKQGISALYLMGVFERDNCYHENKATFETGFKKPEASPLAVTCRSSANKMLGG